MRKFNVKKTVASVMAVMAVAVNTVGMSADATDATPNTGKWSYNSSEYIRIKSSSSAYCYNVFSTTGNPLATGTAKYYFRDSSSSMNETIHYTMSMQNGKMRGHILPLVYYRTGVKKPYLQVTRKYYK